MQKDPEAAAAAGRLLRFFAFGADRDGAADADAQQLGGFEDARDGRLRRTPTRSSPRSSAIGERRDGARLRRRRRRRSACTTPAAFEAAGFNAAEPRGAIAFKYPPEERTTKLLAVEWPVGKIGRVAAARAGRAGLRRRRHGREHHAAQPAADPRARPAHRRHRRGRAPRRRHPVRRPRDRRGPRRQRAGDRPADALPVLRLGARGPRHGRGALVREPAVPGAGDAAAHALGVAAGGRHGGRRRRLDREARRRRRAASGAATSTG